MFRARRRVAETWANEGSRESDRRRRRRDANPGGRRSSGELGARSMVHRDVVRARARPVPSVRRDTPRRRVGRARSHLGRYQQIVRGGRVCVTRVGEGEVGSGKSVRARRGVRARAPRQTRAPRSRRWWPSESRSFTRWAAVSAPVREKPASARFIRSPIERESSPSRCTTRSGGSNPSHRRRGSDRSTPPRRTRRSKVRSSPRSLSFAACRSSRRARPPMTSPRRSPPSTPWPGWNSPGRPIRGTPPSSGTSRTRWRPTTRGPRV